MDRSVGGNIDEYLNCLASSWSSARSFCKNTITEIQIMQSHLKRYFGMESGIEAIGVMNIGLLPVRKMSSVLLILCKPEWILLM